MSDQEKPDSRLPYRDGREDRWDEDMRTQAIAYALITGIGGVIGVAVLLFAAFPMDYRGSNQPSGMAGSIVALTLITCALLGLVVLAIRWQKSYERRGAAIGIWIGLGIAALVEGICFGQVFLR